MTQPAKNDSATRPEQAPRPLLQAKDVSVSYWLKQGLFHRKKHYALRNVSFDLYPGDSLGVIGRNGCGKSSLLRLLAGVMTPDSGHIEGLDTIRTSLLSLQLGFLDYLSGRENAILSGMFLGLTRPEIETRMDAIIDFAELGDFINEPLATYSSGMRARLGFAVAFQVTPDILLVDEVLGVGDAEFRHKAIGVMRDCIRSESSTVVFVSHSAGQVRSLCNKVLWLDHGQVVALGETDEVVDRYEATMEETVAPFSDSKAPVFFRRKGSNKIYILQDNQVNPIPGFQEFSDLGGRAKEVRIVSDEDFENLLSNYGKA